MKSGLSKVLSILLVFSLALSVFTFAAQDSYAAAKPKYIAHRGWSSKAPENTRPALKLAAKNSKFYGVEFDIWESTAEKGADPLLLVMHDENIKRMCGVNKSIRSITRANRTKYKIKSGNNIRKYKNVVIPTADMALKAIWDNSNGAIPVIELKHKLSARALNYLFDLIGDHKVSVISFDYDAVIAVVNKAKARGVSENVQTMYLMNKLSSSKYTSTAKKLKKAGIDCASIKYTYVNRTAVKTFHKYGIGVCTWTLPNKKTAAKYAKMGVDYITANGAVY
jgi:glycerophosphoryl diester phosphodiesterase